MASTKEILNFLRDKDFSEEELERYINELVYEKKVKASNDSLYQFTTKKRSFLDKRDARLIAEFNDHILPEINDLRQAVKLARAQGVYKANRKAKKNKQKSK